MLRSVAITKLAFVVVEAPVAPTERALLKLDPFLPKLLDVSLARYERPISVLELVYD